MSRARTVAFAVVVSAASVAGTARAGDPRTVAVGTRDELIRAVAAAVPGTRIEIAPGTYDGGLHFVGLRGAAGKPVVLAAKDAANAPVLRGGANGIQLSDPEHVELHGLVFTGQTGNGLNIDDGSTPATPAHHVVLRDLVVRDVGPDGNRDGIKLSGLTDFRVEGSTVERWGRGGSAVDMVGCARGVIERCTFRHTAGATQASGVQAKGATRDVVIRRNRFEHAGSRAVNAGGSTGLEYFRPPLAEWKGPRWEAKDLRVEGNTIIGSQAAVAFVGVDGATFRFNTIHRPGRWAARLLQETRAEGFAPSGNVAFTDNLVVFRSDAWSEGGVNVGDGTAPATCRFERNFWFCEDAPERTRALVRTPAEEKDGVHGKDPRLRDAEAGDVRLKPGSPAAKFGADAFPE